MRGRADPDAAEADLDPADQVELVGEDLARVEPAVAVGVLEDQDAVAGLVVGDADRVRIRLGDPEPAAVVDRERDRLDDVGLAGEERDLEARRARSSPAAASAGESPSWAKTSARRRPGRAGPGGRRRPERKSSKLTCPQPAAVAVDQPDEDLLAEVRPTGRRRPASAPRCRRPTAWKTTACVSCRTTSTRVVGCDPPPTRNRGERLRERERRRGQRPLGPVALPLVAADPELPGVPALHPPAARVDRVPLDRLARRRPRPRPSSRAGRPSRSRGSGDGRSCRSDESVRRASWCAGSAGTVFKGPATSRSTRDRVRANGEGFGRMALPGVGQ